MADSSTAAAAAAAAVNVRSWTPADCADWVEGIGLPEYRCELCMSLDPVYNGMNAEIVRRATFEKNLNGYRLQVCGTVRPWRFASKTKQSETLSATSSARRPPPYPLRSAFQRVA